MGKNIGLMFCLLIGLNFYGQQNTMSFKVVDSTSYALFLKQDWKSLIELGKTSKKNGIDFYYLKVRLGIANFKEGKYLIAIKYLEQAYQLNKFDVVVQDYLYWAYHYGGMPLEADMLYAKMDANLKDSINKKLLFVSGIDVGIVATNNSDFDALLTKSNGAESIDYRIFPEKYQLYMLGFNHRFSRSTNFYHRLTVMPTSLLLQENVNGSIKNSSFKGTETRYYADATFGLGKRWYLDTNLGLFFGSFNEVAIFNDNPINTSLKSKYTDVLFGVSVSRSCYYLRQSLNISYSNLGEFNQFQAGYSLSLYPLGNTLLVPFGSFQYQNETSDVTDETHIVYTGGISINTKDVTITGYFNSGEMHNFNSNNGSVIYNQSAICLNEYGAIMQIYIKKAVLKLGYSFMNMEDYYFTDEIAVSSYKFNQQNLIAGFTWNF